VTIARSSETKTLRLFGVVRVLATASVPSLVELGPLVEPPVVPWNMQCSTGIIGTIVRATLLELFSVGNQSPAVAMV